MWLLTGLIKKAFKACGLIKLPRAVLSGLFPLCSDTLDVLSSKKTNALIANVIRHH